MPNWSKFTLIVAGPEAEVERFWEGLVKEEEDGTTWTSVLKSYHPMPEVLKGTVSGCEQAEAACEQNYHAVIETGFKNWYDWAMAHWGVKWFDRARVTCNVEGLLELSGETPWSPPIEGLSKVFADFPRLRAFMAYDEETGAFSGTVYWENGEIVSDIYDDHMRKDDDGRDEEPEPTDGPATWEVTKNRELNDDIAF